MPPSEPSGLTDDAWHSLLRQSAEMPGLFIGEDAMPGFPSAQVQTNTVGQAGAGALDEAWVFAEACLRHFRRSPSFAAPNKLLMDFGTGWARIARCFLRDFRARHILGVDVDPALLTLSRTLFPGATFAQVTPMPPFRMANERIDFITGYSVFSHLSEVACRAWMEEFARVLRPGGMVALTTRGRWFFDYAASLAGQPGYGGALGRMFPDFDAAKAGYDAGQFVHSNAPGVAGGGALDGSFYGESFIPEAYARGAYADLLDPVEFMEVGGHPIMIFAKR
jgi:SAM-dependent methyltransferase